MNFYITHQRYWWQPEEEKKIMEEYDLAIEREITKIQTDRLAWHEAAKTVMETLFEDLTEDEIAEAFGQSAVELGELQTSFTKYDPDKLWSGMRQILVTYWFNTKVNEAIEKSNNFKGE